LSLKKYIINFFIILAIALCSAIPIKANNLAVIDIESIINSNNQYVNLLNTIQADQKDYKNSFQSKEEKLKNQYAEIENSKLVLNDEEFENAIKEYNIKIKNFDDEINKFNTHYEKQISIYRNLIIENILDIIKEYALSNQIDLILDSKNYIMASNSINITDIVLQELNKKQLDINFEPY